MTWDRVAIVERQLDAYLESAEPAARRLAPDAPLRAEGGLTAGAAVALFEDQLTSRQLDVVARELKKTNRSFYTIGSAGHENNAVRRRAAANRRPGVPPLPLRRVHDGPRSPAAGQHADARHSARDRGLERRPDRQGRHKVWGSRPLWVPPQTSTIASHLPKAMGLAFSLAPRQPHSGSRTGCRPTPSWSARSATPARTTPPRCRRSTRRATRSGSACRCRCCSSARTTAPASACRRRTAGSPARSGRRRTCATSAPTASSTRSGTRSLRPVEHVRERAARRRSCTCAPSACGATPAAMRSRPIGHVPEIEAIEARDPLLRTAPPAGRARVRRTRDAPRSRSRDTRPRRGRGRGSGSATTTADDRGGHGAPRAVATRPSSRLRATVRLATPEERAAVFVGGAAGIGHRANVPNAGGSAQRGARGRDAAPPRGIPVRRGRRAQGRRLQRDQRPPEALRRGARLRHAARRDEHPRHRPGRGASRPAAASRRSSTSPTSTTRSTSSAARRRRCSSSARRPVPQPDGRARRRARRTRRASAATSTTTTRSARCATSPAS